MNAAAVIELSKVIHEAQQTRKTAFGVATVVADKVLEPLRADLERTKAESRMYRDRLWAEQNVRWDDELPPGGLVCADPECGQPVESEPCEEHSPRARVIALEAELYTAQAHGKGFMEQRNAHAKELLVLRLRIAELETELHATNEALDDAVAAIRAKDQRITELETAERERGRAEIRTILRRSIGDAEEGDPADRNRAAELRQELADREAEWAEQDAAGAGESL